MAVAGGIVPQVEKYVTNISLGVGESVRELG
jgi:hypothetical protein